MKRSDINALARWATSCFEAHGWTLPPAPRWDVTDFGLGDWRRFGLVLVNLAEEPEYCEKLMYARRGMTTPAHCHSRKKEDIISRWGTLLVRVWLENPLNSGPKPFTIPVNHQAIEVRSGDVVELRPGWRITLAPGVYHEFVPATGECIIGEVSTANDDVNDNVFENPEVGRFTEVDEDEPIQVRLVSDR